MYKLYRTVLLRKHNCILWYMLFMYGNKMLITRNKYSVPTIVVTYLFIFYLLLSMYLTKI